MSREEGPEAQGCSDLGKGTAERERNRCRLAATTERRLDGTALGRRRSPAVTQDERARLRRPKWLPVYPIVTFLDVHEAGTILPEREQEIEERLARFNETLTAFEFERSPVDHRADFEAFACEPAVEGAELPRLGVTFVIEEGRIRLVRGERTVDNFTSTLRGARPHSVHAFPEVRSVVYQGMYEVAEGCDSGPETRLEVFATQHLSNSSGPSP